MNMARIQLLLTLTSLGPWLAWATLDNPCTWSETALITDEDPEPECTDKCFSLCNKYPSEYMCSGFTIFIDDEDKRIDTTSTDLFTHCLCQVSKATRMTGELCGHAAAPCTEPPMFPEANIQDVAAPQYVGGWNTFMEGFQGDRAVAVNAKGVSYVNPEEASVVCNPLLYSELGWKYKRSF